MRNSGEVQERNSVVARMLIDVDRYELWENLRNAFEASQVPGTTTSMCTTTTLMLFGFCSLPVSMSKHTL